jgi:hypothetical protein
LTAAEQLRLVLDGGEQIPPIVAAPIPIAAPLFRPVPLLNLPILQAPRFQPLDSDSVLRALQQLLEPMED